MGYESHEVDKVEYHVIKEDGSTLLVVRHLDGHTAEVATGATATIPTVVCSLAASTSSYHQASQVIVQGTFVAPATSFKLRAQVAGYVSGADYSGVELSMIVGIPVVGGNNCGGILGEEVTQVGGVGHGATVGTLLLPLSQKGSYGGLVSLGTILGEFAAGQFTRDVVYGGALPGATYTVQIIAGAVSGFDSALHPTAAANLFDGMAVTPAYDTSPDNSSKAMRDLWVIDRTANAMLRFSIGRRPLGRYEGVQPRLVYKNTLAIASTITFGKPVIDKNGKMAVFGPTANTVTIVDTTANSHAGAVLVTTAAFASTVDDVAAAPDGSGFWVAVHNTGLVKINPTTGATITTWALAYLTMRLVISNDSTIAYVWTSGYPGIMSINLATGAATVGPPIAQPSAMALSPDGRSLLLVANPSQAVWDVAKIALPALPALPNNAVAVTYATRLGVVMHTNDAIYSVAISANSKMFFFAGDKGVWGYGWVSTMAIFDGRTVTGGATQPAGQIIVTENDGIYVAESGGSGVRYDGVALPQARIYGWPGSLFTCQPDGTNNGTHYADVLL